MTESRQQAIDRIQKAHDETELEYVHLEDSRGYDERPISHLHRAELLNIVAEVERENKELRGLLNDAADDIDSCELGAILK